jgi:hypothetical protein
MTPRGPVSLPQPFAGSPATVWRQVGIEWREARAAALDDLLRSLANVEAAYAGDERFEQALRGLAALTRERRSDELAEQRKLEALEADG